MKLNDIVKQILVRDIDDNSYSDFYIKQDNAKYSFFESEQSGKSLIQTLLWPMTSFHIIAYIFDTNDSYQGVVASLGQKTWSKRDREEAKEIGNEWAKYLSQSPIPRQSIPLKLHELFFEVFKERRPVGTEMQLSRLLIDENFMTNALKLLIASDQCARKIEHLLSRPKNPNLVSDYMNNISTDSGIKTLSEGLDSYGSIHVKTMTPQSGISINSLSHSIAYVKPGIDCFTLKGRTQKKNDDLYHVLILPWPLNIERDFFSIDTNPPLEMDPNNFGFFAYNNKEKITTEMVLYAINEAEKEVSFPDLVVIPECAIAKDESNLLAQELIDYFTSNSIHPPLFIYGAYDHSQPGQYGKNYLEFIYYDDFNNRNIRVDQPKHHRWALDRNQIISYKLGTKLTPKKKWWENCEINSRKIISYFDDDTHICPLICEDLARQDPIAPVVRSLGPSLVVALLLDGPQMKGRWPEKYAGVLAEDPGSSVLSVSPYGMTQRSTGLGYPPSSSVALWSDGDTTVSLDLTEKKVGISLALEKRSVEQWAADGRWQLKKALKYAGHISVGLKSNLDEIKLKVTVPQNIPVLPTAKSLDKTVLEKTIESSI
ncbi:hypothetical protein C9I87_18255 [Photobacterium iliopiscarium]|uniref:hypothetical protein n=1 Tax=Photobacterium iliopiscarium TaxID=56192 RepID=UPI000D16F20B|nr:hypothetical protein [Photobacterium iliopiscarium]PST87269.1 hypothetical protein C9I87_18255 [Photobacterium iliopiscarium]